MFPIFPSLASLCLTSKDSAILKAAKDQRGGGVGSRGISEKTQQTASKRFFFKWEDNCLKVSFSIFHFEIIYHNFTSWNLSFLFIKLPLYYFLALRKYLLHVPGIWVHVRSWSSTPSPALLDTHALCTQNHTFRYHMD